MRSIRAARCSGASATISWIVEQFGLAIIPLCRFTSCGLTSGTTSGTSGSMRNALELSITTAPALTAAGTRRLLISPPALKKVTSTPSKAFSSRMPTWTLRPEKGTRVPAERSEASGLSSVTVNFRSSSTFSISLPTAPVAPATATFTTQLLARWHFGLAPSGLSWRHHQTP